MDANCGYRGLGHFCTTGKVQFISRYHLSNDYCIDGRRVTLADDGQMSHEQLGDRDHIRAFEQESYQEYLRWHDEQRQRYGESWPPAEPFICPA